MIITIDGGAATGTSTAAKGLARALDLAFLDSGALYRTIALIAQEENIDPSEEYKLEEIALTLPITFIPAHEDSPQQVILGDRDVSHDIRTHEVSARTPHIARIPCVRDALIPLQRRLGAQGCVVEGRDMGTTVFPNADYKFFFIASIDIRVQRRRGEYEELYKAGKIEKVPELEEIKEELLKRDHHDSSRAHSPFKKPEDAIEIDTSFLSKERVLEEMLKYIQR